jgi:hypothetical protein
VVAISQVGAREQIEDIVGARAANNAIGIEPECAADRLAQVGRGAIRIILQMPADRRIGFDRAWARPQRRLVGGEFVNLVDARRAALARHIGLDVEHTRTRLRTL